MSFRRTSRLVVALIVAVAALAITVPAGAGPSFPARIELPTGFRPEGIAVGRGTTFYVGSLENGALYRGDLRTGAGSVIFPGDAAPSVGVASDNGDRVFVAGGGAGTAKVIDGSSGALLATYHLASGPTFVNDVVVAKQHAWFTDSQQPVLYRIPVDGGPASTVLLSGDYQHDAGAFNLNGIEATPNGTTLLAVQSGTGTLFTIDPATGVTREIDAGGYVFTNGDGLLLHGQTLYVVQNRLNQVAVVDLSPDLSAGTVVAVLTTSDFDVPTTVDRFGSGLYFVNARFGNPSPATADYWITRLSR